MKEYLDFRNNIEYEKLKEISKFNPRANNHKNNKNL